MMAAEGRCKALDAAADGYVRSEACVSVLLNPLASPEDTGAGGWAVMLHGTAVNQGGRSSTLTAPNGPSQQAVIRAALDEAELAPASITALSMHGTGETAPAHVLHGRFMGIAAPLACCGLPHRALTLNCPSPLAAGTPLGDPIEVGAAAAVLVEGQNAARVRQPLTLLGSKSWVGHSGEWAGKKGASGVGG